MNINYNIGGGLSRKQQDEIHLAALKLLDTIGFMVSTAEATNDELLAAMKAHDGVAVRNGRLCFKPNLVEKLLDEHRQEMLAAANSIPSLIIPTIGHAFNVYDDALGKLRPCVTDDCIRFIKLANSYHDNGVICSCPGFPSDVPKKAQALASYKLGCEYSVNKASVAANSVEVGEAIYEMSSVMGYSSTENHIIGMHPVSPLRLEGTEFDIAIRMWKKLGNKLSVSCGPMPMLGVSTPIYFPSAIAQTIAEAVGSFVFFKLLTGKSSFWLNFYAFDMKNGVFSYGGPEDLLIALIRRQMNDYYGLPQHFGDKALCTMAHAVDSQAAGEKAAKTVVSLMAGSHTLACAGSLSLDESFASEQLVVDIEIVNWAKHVAKGFEYDASMLDVAHVTEGVNNGGDFLSMDNTLRDYRSTYWIPELFDHLMHGQWQRNGSKSIVARAREIADTRVKAEKQIIGDDKKRELDRIYEAFIKKMI